MRRIAFLDRDGVINKDLGHVCSKERFQWVDGAREAIRFLNQNNYLVIIVTNQAGIAKGFYTDKQFHYFMNWIQLEFKKVGAYIDRYYYCPHHVDALDEYYQKNCNCRKPRPGLLLKAIGDLSPDLKESFLVGDKQSDLIAARSVGMIPYLFNENQDLNEFIKKIVEGRIIGK